MAKIGGLIIMNTIESFINHIENYFSRMLNTQASWEKTAGKTDNLFQQSYFNFPNFASQSQIPLFSYGNPQMDTLAEKLMSQFFNRERKPPTYTSTEAEEKSSTQIGRPDKRYYDLLGLDSTKDYSEQEINRAYRMRSLKVHPDKNPSPEASEQFQKLTEAKELILDYINE